MNISTSTKLYAVIGDPIEHSLSPTMHNLAFHNLGLDSVYLAFRVRPESLKDAIFGLKSLGIHGFNVTVPHKVSVMQYLDKIDDAAAKIGAVNTVVNKNGLLIGYNTDGAGALTALKDEGVNFKGLNVVLLGAGGAAKALASAIAPLVGCLLILNRTESKAEELASSIAESSGSNVKGEILTEASLNRTLPDADILINATSVGMYPNLNDTPVMRTQLHSGTIVFDIVYNPPRTRLLMEAIAAGAYPISGVKMLVHQGALAFKLWTGKEPPIAEMCKVVEESLRRNAL